MNNGEMKCGRDLHHFRVDRSYSNFTLNATWWHVWKPKSENLEIGFNDKEGKRIEIEAKRAMLHSNEFFVQRALNRSSLTLSIPRSLKILMTKER